MKQEIVKSENQVVVSEQELIGHLQNLGLTKDLTDGERNTYLSICKAFNLNPFKREVHVSKYNGQMAVITGYETYIKRAERSGVLDGWSVTTTGEAKDNSLKATITIYRKDRGFPFVWEVKYSEYVKLKDGRPNQFWAKAETMTKKVAIAQGFRLCFSDELGGMPYTSDEIGSEVVEDIQHEQVPAQTPTTAKTAPAQTQAQATEPKKKSKLSEKAIADACSKIASGKVELIQMIIDQFDITPEQLARLEAAAPKPVEPIAEPAS